MNMEETQSENLSDDVVSLVHDNHNVHITCYAFSKINMYARLVSSMIGYPSEVMGLLIGEPDDEHSTAREAYLIPDQNSNPSEVYPDRAFMSHSYSWAIRNKKRIVGIWHSHGSHPPFHSEYDNSNLRGMARDNTYTLKNTINIDGKLLPYASSIVINQSSYLEKIPYLSLISGKHYYCVAAVRDTQNIVHLSPGLGMELIGDPDDALPDERKLALQVCQRVKHKGKYLGEIIRSLDDHLSDTEQQYGDVFYSLISQQFEQLGRMILRYLPIFGWSDQDDT